MTSSIIRFSSGGELVRNPPHRAPVATSSPATPQWRSAHAFVLPIAGAMLGALWAVLVATIVGFHAWMVIPLIVGAAYGHFLGDCFA